MRRFLYFTLCALISYLGNAQNNREELSGPLSGNQQIKARERITLKAGFHYDLS